MRSVIYLLNVSLDGFVAGPNGAIDWADVDEELHQFFNDQVRAMDAFLYGRRMYELMADSWPSVDADPTAPAYMVEFARIWKDKPKIVFSQTLDHVDWNARLVRGNVADEIARLKSGTGGDLALGGATIAATCARLGLIDEYRLVVHQVVLGGGTPYFPALDEPIALRLLETRTFGSGAAYWRYQRADRG